jgi:hypothetical protein
MKETQIRQQVRQALDDALEGRLTGSQAVGAMRNALGSIEGVTYAKAHTGDRYTLTVSNGRDRYSLEVEGLNRRDRVYVEQEIIRPLAAYARFARVPDCIMAA